MFTKNYLTRNLKSFLILPDVKCSKKESLTRLNVSGVLRQQIPLVAFHRGAFVVPNYLKNLYVRSTKRKKTSPEKLAKSRFKKLFNHIISQIQLFVKGIFENVSFKPKSPVF